MKKNIRMRGMILAGALAMGLGLSGCGSSDSTTSATTGTVTEGTTVEMITKSTKSAAEDATIALAEGGSTEAVTEAGSTEAEEEDEENYNTGDASLDKVRNEDGIGEKELLVISFGTSYNDSRRLTIGAIEETLANNFSEYSVRRGFTADIIIDHVERRDGIHIDNIDEALKRAVDNNVKKLVIQPTHLMNGIEYDELTSKVANYADAFDQVEIGSPLLTSDDDFKRVENAIVDWTKEYDDGKTAIVFMGHGTEAASNGIYAKMQNLLTADGYANYYIGTVEASPSLEDVLNQIKDKGYTRVVLEPLMVVAGDHANNDMAGDEEDSWKTAFSNAGYEVVCLLRGLGENETIRQIYVDHVKEAIDKIQ
jgi:sirohydrochlorin cobaltochelatase